MRSTVEGLRAEVWSPDGELVELPVVSVELAISGSSLVVGSVMVELPTGEVVDAAEDLPFHGWGFHQWVTDVAEAPRQTFTIAGVAPAELLPGDEVAELGRGRRVELVDPTVEPAVVTMDDGGVELIGGEVMLTVRRLTIYTEEG